jgi:catechol 2,3-dioxygenase-like lactoylglutathione lyase family enzyme
MDPKDYQSGGLAMRQPGDVEPTFEGICPVFPVLDVRAALAFYQKGLGFDLGWTWDDPPTHANICRGSIDITLTLNTESDSLSTSSAAGSGNAYIGLRGIDAYFAELRGRNVICGDLADRPYGMRDFAVIDPSGNRLVFGEPIAG